MYGVIDIGSNTIRLNIYHVYNSGFKLILKQKFPAGLVNYIQSDKLSKTGIELASNILAEMKNICDSLQIKDVLVFATAPLRNISNYEFAKEAIENNSGLSIRILTGREEGAFSYRGAIYDVQIDEGIVVDIGGGSTELVYFKDDKIKGLDSMDIGSLNTYNKYVDRIIPTKNELKQINKKAKKKLEKVDLHTEKSTDIIGVGGSLRAALAINNFIHDYDHTNNLITYKELNNILDCLTNNYDNTKTTILKVKPERIHTIMPGIRILKTICKKYDTKNIYVSEYGVREGYLAKYLEDNNILDEDNNNILDISFINDNISVENKIVKHTEKAKN